MTPDPTDSQPADTPAPHKGPRGRRLWLRRLTLLGLAAALVASVVVWRLTRPERVARLAGEYLARITGAEVEVSQAHLHLDGSVEIQGVQMSLPGDLPLEAARLFHVRQVLIRHSWMSLLRGRLEPSSLVFSEPTIYLTEDAQEGAFLYERLLDAGRYAAGLPPYSLGASREAPRLPRITVRQGKIAFGTLREGEYRVRAVKLVEGQLVAAVGEDSIYGFRLRIEDSVLLQNPELEPIVLTGRLDMQRLRLEAEIPAFAFDRSQGAYLPGPIRSWWRELEPDGSVRAVRFGYDPSPKVRWHAELELADIEMDLPIPLVTETGETRMTRMTGVSGRVFFRNRELATDIRGSVHGPGFRFEYQVQGATTIVDPSHDLLDAPFEFEVRIAGRIPDEKLAWPPLLSGVEQILRRFEPTGELLARVQVKRERPQANPSIHGEVELRDATARFFKFPYPLERVQAVFRFTESEFEVVELQGHGPTGAEVSITGQVAPLTPEAAVALTIIGRDVPLDPHLYAALPEHRQSVVGDYVHLAAYERLLARGVVRGADQVQDASSGGAPVFVPGGRVSMVTTVERHLGSNQPYRVTTAVDLKGASLVCRVWPYPVEVVSGRIVLSPGQVHCDQLELRGLTGARGKLDGRMRWPAYVLDDRRETDIHVELTELPLDRLLLASLAVRDEGWSLRTPDEPLLPEGLLERLMRPGPAQEADVDDWLMRIVAPRRLAIREGAQRLEAGGWFDARAKIHRAPTRRVLFEIEADLRDGMLRPFGGQATIAPLAGALRIHNDGALFERLEGRFAGGDVVFTGQATWGDAGQSLSLHASGKGLPIDRRVLEIMPPSEPLVATAADLLRKYGLQGRFDAELDTVRHADARLTYALRVLPLELQATLGKMRVSLSGMTGEIEMTPGALVLRNLAAGFGDESVRGRAVVNGRIFPGGVQSPGADLSFDVQAAALDDTARALLPAGVLHVIDALEIDGQYHLRADRLVLGGLEAGGEAMRFEARVELFDARAHVGLPITDLQGVLTLRAVREGPSDPLSLSIALDAGQLRAAGRLLEPLTVRLESSAQDPARLDFTRLEGLLYGGRLTGTGYLTIDAPQAYNLDLTLAQVPLEALLNPAKVRPIHAEAANGHDVSGGNLAARLTVHGETGNPAARRGRGEMRIEEARMYELPLALTMLQILNVTVPRSTSFDQASAKFLILGDEVQFDSIRFEAPSIVFSGTGVMDIPTRGINLEFVTRNPSGPKLGALSELGTLFKDQIVRVQVTGTLDQPQTRVRSLTGVERTLRDIFGGQEKDGARP